MMFGVPLSGKQSVAEGVSHPRPRFFLLVFTLVVVLLGVFVSPKNCSGQAFLEEALKKLDVDEDGEIEPEEITPLSRPFLERIARARRISIDRDNDVEDWQEAARIYFALKNGVSGRDVRPNWEPNVKGFGPDEDEAFIPEFGLAEVKYQYTQDDIDEARSTMRRCDRNDDGFLDRREVERNRWTHRNPMESDLDNDGRLSRMELIQRYARRRLLDDAADELRRKAWRTENKRDDRRRRDRDEDRRRERRWWERGGSDSWLTASLIGRFDANRNGRLEQTEAAKLGFPIGSIDIDRDGIVLREELLTYVSKLQNEARGTTIEGLPDWFSEKDADRDGQVAMVEFTQEWTQELMKEFTDYDQNADGFLTALEVTSAKSAVGGSYRNDEPIILAPRKTVISEIEVSDDFQIGDLNLQLSITHTHVSHLDAYLTGPDGKRIELFAGNGGHDDHFDKTIFDDEAGPLIVKSKPPFRGSFKPSGVSKKQPGLSHFKGKSTKGVWQLVVRGSRNERFGMLHNWSLIVKPVIE